MNDLFKLNNLLTTFKAMIVGIVFAIVYAIWTLLVAGIALKYPTVAAIIMLAFFIIALFLWGYLARKFWGWK